MNKHMCSVLYVCFGGGLGQAGRTSCQKMHRLSLDGLSSRRARETGVLFEGEHCKTQHKVTINQKVDRNLLMVVHEQNKMVMSFKMSIFGPIADETQRLPKTDEVLMRASPSRCHSYRTSWQTRSRPET